MKHKDYLIMLIVEAKQQIEREKRSCRMHHVGTLDRASHFSALDRVLRHLDKAKDWKGEVSA